MLEIEAKHEEKRHKERLRCEEREQHREDRGMMIMMMMMMMMMMMAILGILNKYAHIDNTIS